MGRMLQNLQIILGTAAFITPFAKPIVGDAKPRRREQVVAIGVVCERARLADQRIDHVPIMHPVLMAASQTWQGVHLFVRVPDLNTVGEQPRFDLLADEPAVHRIHVAMDVNQAPRIDPASHLQTRRQPRIGQVPQHGLLLGEAIATIGIPRCDQLFQEVRILFTAGEVAAATQ